MGLGWTILGGLAGATAKASASLATGITGAVHDGVSQRGRFAARSGVLGPGDADPPPHSGDFYDYRGLLPVKALSPLAGMPFRLGAALDVHKGPRFDIGLTSGVLERHAAIIGPTGSGKTSSLVIPWIASALQEGSSVVAIDVTGDLLDQILAYRSVVGQLNARVARWDFTRPRESMSWNWLADLSTHESIRSAVDAIVGRENPADPQPFFAQRDRRVLAALIEAVRAANTEPSPNLVLRAAHDPSLLRRLAQLHPASRSALDEITSQPGAEFSRAMSGIANALAPFEHPNVRAITDRVEYTVESAFDTPSLIVVGAPLSGGSIATSVSALLISQVIRTLYQRFGSNQGTNAFLVLDEAARLADRINYEELLSVSRRARVSVVLAMQNVTQFKDKDEREAILNNCSTYVSLPTPSRESASFFISRLGERRQSSLGISRDGRTMRSHYTRSSDLVDVVPHREVMDPPWGDHTAVVHSTQVSAAPFLVDLARRDLAGAP